MKNKTLAVFFIGIILLLSVYSFFLLKKDHVIVTCHYMAYACEEGCPQYKVDKVVSSKDYSFLLGKEIKTVFVTKGLENNVGNMTGECVTCYTFKFGGEIKRSFPFLEYELEITSASFHLRDKDCCK